MCRYELLLEGALPSPIVLSYEALKDRTIPVFASLLRELNLSLPTADMPRGARARWHRLRGIATAAHLSLVGDKAHSRPVLQYISNAEAVQAARPAMWDFEPRCGSVGLESIPESRCLV
jgi:hypothetical protein